MRTTLVAGLTLILVAGTPDDTVAQQADLSFLLTRAERTDYLETTGYDELIGFLEVAVGQNDLLREATLGYSTEGRRLPLIIFGNVPDTDAATIRSSKYLRVYIQGNIHAGEVCGKEALLMLIRSLASGEHSGWAESVILLIAPIYNADGNERVNLYNRPRQNGPLGGMGQRPNAQGLDLNRDHMKVQSPEARSFVRMMKEYDPHLLVDLHTTNGTRHGYQLTYAPPLHPNTDSAMAATLRNVVLPALQSSMRNERGFETNEYGNLPYRSGEPGWYTFDHRPRFNNNYVGLRNRLGILSEAYAYASFKQRIDASLAFTEEIVDYAADSSQSIIQLIEKVDARSVVGDSLALRAEHAVSDSTASVLLGQVDRLRNPYSGAIILSQRDTTWTQTMPAYTAFESTENTRVPDAYFVVDAVSDIRKILDTHGVKYEVTTSKVTLDAEQFRIDSTRTEDRKFQNVHQRTLYGEYERVTLNVPRHSLNISMRQPLARLIFSLLEPRSDDGLVNWALLDDVVTVSTAYPVIRTTGPPPR